MSPSALTRPVGSPAELGFPAEVLPTYFELTVAPVRRHPVLFWAVLSSACVAACLGAFEQSRRDVFLLTYFPLAVAVAAVPLAMRFVFHVLHEWRQAVASFVRASPARVDDWYYAHFAGYLSSRLPQLAALLYVAVALVTLNLAGAYEDLPGPLWALAAALTILPVYLCGIAIAGLLYLGRMIWDVGSFSVTVAPHQFGVMATGTTLVRCYAAAAMVWCIFTACATWGLDAGWIVLASLAAPSVVVIIGSFVICQLPLHWRMVEYKRGETLRVEQIVASLRPAGPSELSKERQDRLAYFQNLRDEIAALPEWPFRWRSLAGVSASAVGSIAPALFKLAFPTVSAVLQLTGF